MKDRLEEFCNILNRDFIKKPFIKDDIFRHLSNINYSGALSTVKRYFTYLRHSGTIELVKTGSNLGFGVGNLPSTYIISNPIDFKHVYKIRLENQRILNAKYRKPKGNRSKDTNVAVAAILKAVESGEIDIADRLPYGFVDRTSEKLNLKKNTVKHAVKKAKQQLGNIKCKVNSQIVPKYKTFFTEFQQYCLDNELYRSAPNLEKDACDTINQALIYTLPPGGRGMIIGTAAPWCACPDENNNLLLLDNFVVASILQQTTKTPLKIFIGNAVNAKKSELKASHWRAINTTHNSEVCVGKLDSYSYHREVTLFAKENDLTKVILMTSGPWESCKETNEKYGLNMNFKDPSIDLMRHFKNLHILAMKLNYAKKKFDIIYLHDGNMTIL